MSVATLPPPPAADVVPLNTGTDDTDLLARLSAKHNVSEEAPVLENTPPPSGEEVVAETPVAEKPVETPAPNPNAAAAAKRVSDKKAAEQKDTELAELRAKLAELQTKADMVPDLETKYVETKTLAEQREIELEEHRKRYKNEVETLNPQLISEVPEVRAAQERYNSIASGLFPVDISNPLADEADLRFDPNSLTPEQATTITNMLNRWEKEELNSSAPANHRAQVQHIVLSNIAAAIGVDPSKFQEINVGGAPYNVIPPSHPVYQHLKSSVRPFINARREFNQTQEQAKASVLESGKTIVGGRVANTKKMFADSGLGLTGESLKASLAKSPDSEFLKAMTLVDADPELLAELQENIEAESATNGYFRPTLDLFEPDLKARDTAAQAHMRRIGRRVLHGALGPVLLKKALKQDALIREKDELIAKLQAEAEKTLIQAEPGAISGQGDTPKDSKTDGLSAVELALAKKHGLL